MDLADILELKFPGSRGIILQDDGNGPYIKEWNLEISKPIQSEIDQWTIELSQQYELLQNKLKNQVIYDQLGVIDLKSIRALRSNDIERLTLLEQEAIILRDQLLPVV